ncbi:hypothetical protein [Fodinibius salsisoli]|uniref:DUF937 domain-containing protein n=1 Tax=Fodinibius salsisoli TaxID=2820877 RepID=A0ABT3PTA2_9BACT|nr:hypothetical protein [Fodinibius salsisoli]MCW9709099.1 hypothetical protein [Fodinibius salsisoli]
MKTYKQLLLFICTCGMLVLSGQQVGAQNSELSSLFEKAKQAGVEEASLTELQDRAQAQGISSQQLRQILQSAVDMSARNLPGELAIDKALEGFSKGIPGNRIIAVLDQVQQSMVQATDIVDPWLNRPAVQEMLNQAGSSMPEQNFRNDMARAASRSLMKNVSPGNISTILSQIESDPVVSKVYPADMVAAMQILSDLPTTADQPEQSASFIIRALRGGFNANELQQLPAALKMGQQRSQLPAASVVDGVARQMEGGIPAKQILDNLFNGKVGGGPPGNVPKGLENRPERGNGSGNRGN